MNLWDSFPEVGANLCDSEWGWGDSVFVVGRGSRVWGRVCPDWEACSLYLLEVGMREWEKLGES